MLFWHLKSATWVLILVYEGLRNMSSGCLARYFFFRNKCLIQKITHLNWFYCRNLYRTLQLWLSVKWLLFARFLCVLSFITLMCVFCKKHKSLDDLGTHISLPVVHLFSELINFTQPVYVWRDDPDSRQNTIKEIISRATSDLDWPQILIFPEGTCTNRSCLITFKPGAFYPGVPVQPVCIRYPNKLDTVTWTWEGPSA